MAQQTTLRQATTVVGQGLHSGQLIRMQLKPAAAGTGIVFVRTDLDGVRIPATVDYVDFQALKLATSLRSGDVKIQTIEHLMSAFYGRGVDNAVVEIDGPELPIMDGSAEPFLILIDEAGIKELAAPKHALRIVKTFRFEYDGKCVVARPSKDFKITYEIEFDHPLIRRQRKTVTVRPGNYERQIARARTFGFLKDVNALKKLGLARGGSLDNAIVLDGDRMLNDSLRYDDEFVSHKILDFVGDLALSSMTLRGHFEAERAGHEVHARFLRALLAEPQYYTVNVAETVESGTTMIPARLGEAII